MLRFRFGKFEFDKHSAEASVSLPVSIRHVVIYWAISRFHPTQGGVADYVER